jgi:hypothetical protein
MPRMTASATVGIPLARVIQPSSSVLRKGSVAAHPLWSDSERTRAGCRAARCVPTAAPSETPATWARSTSIASRNAASWSAYASVEYGPAGFELSPEPGRSTPMQRKCSV